MNPGEHFGAYELLELLGRGGMGEVWKARDTNLGRVVAIKFIKELDSENLARFRREARIVARLAHPHIAALYEIGEDGGRPYIVMQFVEGVPLDEAPLTIGAKVRALAQAARAVHHAHESGILHRDLKPANILAAPDGRAVVLDFGLAREFRKAPGGTVGTLSLEGDIMGTPAYMSPEQARGQAAGVDARSDVFGLGATLYGLLVGHGPFAADNAYEAIDRVLNFDPPPPPGDADLVTVCLKALEKEPARRYATAADFADDLDRYLAGESVRARRAGLAHLIVKALRKHPYAWSAGVSILVLAAASFAFVVVQTAVRNASIRRQNDDMAQAGLAVAQRRRSLDRENEALSFLQLLHRASDRLEMADRRLARAMSDAKLDAFRAEVRTFEGDLGREIERHPDEGGPYLLRARARRLLGLDREAVADLDAAIARSGTPLARAAAVESRARYERFRLNLDHLRDLFSLGHASHGPEETLRLFKPTYDRVMDDVRHLDSREIPASELDMLTVFDVYFDKSLKDRLALANDVIGRGGASPEFYVARAEERMILNDDWEGSEEDMRTALSIHAGRARFHVILANIQTSTGRLEEALESLDRALKLSMDNPAALCNRGMVLARLGRLDEAERDLRRAVEIDPGVPVSWLNLCNLHLLLGRPEEAFDAADRAVRLSPSFKLGLDARAKLYRRRGELQSALGDLNTALDLYPDYMEAYLDRGAVLVDLQRPREALADLERAVELNADYPEAWCVRGSALRDLHRYREAIDSFTRALDLRAWYASALAQRGMTHGLMRDMDSAFADLNAAIDLDPGYVDARNWRGVLRALGGDSDGAIEDFTAYLEVRADASVLLNRARAYGDTGRWKEAAADLRAALDKIPPGAPHRAAVEAQLREAEERAGDTDF